MRRNRVEMRVLLTDFIAFLPIACLEMFCPMKFSFSLLLAVLLLTFNGCEKQPYSKIKGMKAIHSNHGGHGKHGAADSHGAHAKHGEAGDKASKEHAAH